jgi:hypothetical protein
MQHHALGRHVDERAKQHHGVLAWGIQYTRCVYVKL